MIKYCESVFTTKRWRTREVRVGDVGVGGANPIRIQSMTTSNTRDVEGTIDQVIRLVDAGCEIVRITVQGMKEAEAFEAIKNGLLKKGYAVPLVADIHFYPPAAMKVVEFADKVRINPGNYIDKRASFKIIDYDDHTYALELEKIEEKFTPLVEKCKLLKKALRIGTNHGSLSDRIMNRFGDSPRGMLESALEFARVCRKNNFHDFIFSMKSSNPQVMIQAYRLLVAEMNILGWDYPLHLGVTEAGQGEDGRVKSAMGIGSLLLDGIGDTIRVSLTEDAWNEIDPCQRLVNLATSYIGKGIPPFEESFRDITEIKRRPVAFPQNISLHRDGTVIVSVQPKMISQSNFYRAIGCELQLGIPKIKISTADCLAIREPVREQDSLKILENLKSIGISVFSAQASEGEVRISSLRERLGKNAERSSLEFFVPALAPKIPEVVVVSDETPEQWEALDFLNPTLLILAPQDNRLHYARHFFDWLQSKRNKLPVILNFKYDCAPEDLIITASAECGALLCDGLGDGLWLEGPYDIELLRTLSFNILQAARMRTSKTDFISCPSCGRTLFDLQDVTNRIRSRTSHLPGVKIAIMGCIVNGPGEMADADFGYVGSKPGMIDLYIGKQCVEKDISFAEADDRLIELIKKQGRWVEPDLTLV
ncbi:4-hydroxy-3-methylbut-2-en-1-yl diphosphate synthase [Chlamydiales bacterium STE3]|nr:4-hydroxy-3-methylbut-2-en-1-yl diphosphate synthase [Chlamydiales bacterium STE3]